MMKHSVAILAVAIVAMVGTAVRCGAQTADAREVGPPASTAATSVPRLVQFNGTLKDSAARPVSGVASVTFAIYTEQDGGSALWTETQNVLADSNGHFNALLGTATTGGFPSDLFSTGQSRWLGISIARQPEMPRVMLASVPYAMKAGDADTLGGLPASSYVTTQQLAAHIVATSTTVIASAPQGIGSAPVASASASIDDVSGAATQSVTQATITGTGTANYLPLWTSGTNLGVSKIYQANGGFVGINTNTPLLQLDVNGNSIFRGSFQMAPQGTATASAGQPSHSFQWQSSVYNSSTKAAVNQAFGFRTVPDRNNVPAPTAKLDLFYGPGGGTLTDTGLSIDHTGVVTFVAGQTFNSASVTAKQFNLPNTSGATGVITFGGQSFISNGGDSSSAFVGAGAGASVTGTGEQNAGFGSSALGQNTSGYGNTAIGNAAMASNTTGSYSTAVGGGALEIMQSATENTAVGVDSLVNTTTGSGNTAIGVYAGRNNSTGSNNTFLGYSAGPSVGNLTNATAIGVAASVGESNAMVLGGTASSAVRVGINTATPGSTLEVDDAGFSNSAIYSVTGTVGHNAIFGNSTATSGTGSNGGYFESASPQGSGVAGINDSGGIGGYFEALKGGSAGYFDGDVTVTGTLTKGGGSFKIDDPIDPANKYLSHSFVESPDMMNIYNGNVTTDAKGYATVSMPDWFEALNRDFRYQLTTINSFSRATVAAELKDGKFRIRTSQPHVKVSWQVTGIRHDAWANAHRIPNEEAKPSDEHGKYLHPELFGAGPDKQIGTQPALASTPVNASAASAADAASGRR